MLITTAHEVLSDSHKYFTFVKQLFLNIYDPFSIPCLTVIFDFGNVIMLW